VSIEIVAVLFFACLFGVTFLGLPVALSLGGTAIIFLIIFWGPEALYLTVTQVWSISNNFVLLAIPLFILMAMILEKADIAERLYDAMLIWFGPVRGGLAIGTLVICTIFAAMCGISGTATITMASIALPSMLKRGYDKRLAIGCINSGGGWGILMPPSADMIVYALIAGQSVGRMFAGGVIPTFLLLLLDTLYILIRSFVQPHLGPALPKEERANWKIKISSLRHLVVPFGIIVCVLGSIVFGIASPTEAGAVGVVATMVAARKSLTIKSIYEACGRTFRITGMIMWVIFGAVCMSAIFQGIGLHEVVWTVTSKLPAGKWGVMIFFQAVIFMLAMVMSSSGIMLICVPVMLPIITSLGFDPLWFGILFIVQMQIGYMTPPFGYNLFYIKAVVSKDITMADIYRSVVAFICVEVTGLILLMIFPTITTWLPYKLLPQ
jgi:tripartite ATP-independent transporter DctM subunit